MNAHAQTNNSIATAKMTWTSARSGELKYLIYTPPGYSAKSDKRWPLMLFLHGAGERGSDVQRVAIHGPMSEVKKGTNFPFIIIAPQCPEKELWENEPLLQLLDHTIKQHAVDTKRVYLTGLSMGGYGAWKLGLSHPERFAALAPVCGGVSLIDTYAARQDRAEAIKRLPIWAFHGGKDNVIPPDESARAVNELKEHGVRNLELTIYPDAKHDSWREVYRDPKFYEWLLKQSR